MSQPPLPNLPAGTDPDLARAATGPALAGALLSGDLHLALRASLDRPSAPASCLRAALPQVGDGLAAAGHRSALSGWADWDAGRAANLDTRLALPSAHSLPGARRRA